MRPTLNWAAADAENAPGDAREAFQEHMWPLTFTPTDLSWAPRGPAEALPEPENLEPW